MLEIVDGSAKEPYKAVVWTSHCGSEMIRLTSREEAHLDDQTMMEIALNRFAQFEIDPLRGEFIFEVLD